MTLPFASRPSKNLSPLAILAFLVPASLAVLSPAQAIAGDPENQGPEGQDYVLDPLDPQAIWGGEDAEPCAWPTTVRVTDSQALCTGSLIHPRVVMYAAHCGAQGKTVRFGETSNTSKSREVEYCKINPGYSGQAWDQAHDWAYCVLAEPMTDIPTTPVGFGCEVNQYLHNGQTIAIVGFGNNSGDSGAGSKRWAFTTISYLQNSKFVVGGGGQPTICSGDSGGPAFIQYDDGTWHVYGIASTKSDNTCSSAPGTHSNAVNAVKWIETDSGIDVTPCHDSNGTWNPTALCGNFSTAQAGVSGGVWATYCQDTTALDWSSTCGTDFETLYAEDVPPELNFVIPKDGDVYPDAPALLDVTVNIWDDTPQPVSTTLFINGMEISTSKSAPAVWGGANFPAGEYTLLAHGVDFWGNETSTEVHFTVGDPSSGDTTTGGDSGTDTTTGTDDTTTTGGNDDFGDTGGFVGPGADDDTGCSCSSTRDESPLRGLGMLGMLGLLGLGMGVGRRRRR
ncbi:MAG: trypsin-like serine protease [Myxococcales bacterium]|nr:trypsin-like serine protease [Myxococcales bacterium]